MNSNPHVTVHVNLERIRGNVQAIATLVKVPILAVVKADAYGLGITQVAEAIKDLVSGFCVFELREAVGAQLHELTKKPILALGPPDSLNAYDWRAAGVTPSVSTVEQAAQLRAVRPALCVDTGMQRFAAPPHQIDEILRTGDCRECWTHGTRLEHALKLKELCGGRGLRLHAAGTALLSESLAMLDAVRPGLAMYFGAVRIITHLIEARDTHGPAGYGGFSATRHGVIRMGYAHGLRAGFCSINSQRRRVIEVGMQSAFVEIGPQDRDGDEVILLDENINEQILGKTWGCSGHEVLISLVRSGSIVYES
jgi:alanine racemase